MPQKKRDFAKKKGDYPPTMEGVFNVGKNGRAFVVNRELDLVVAIPSHATNTALHKDIVSIKVIDTKKGIGRVEKITRRAKTGFAGVLKPHDTWYICSPQDPRDPEIIIPRENIPEDAVGKKVFVTITRFGDAGPIGAIEKVIGVVGESRVEMEAIALERGFDENFPEDVNAEAEELERLGIRDEDTRGRKDLRTIPLFTIDPEDAKDFDDALSLVTKENGQLEVGIHIADVSHYVRPNSALETEAQERTTSVYLVDRTIPMLPEPLSNNLCSLREGEEKLAFSAIFTMTAQGEILDEWFGKTLIRSQKRFTYAEAQEVIDSGKGPFATELLTLNRIAKEYTKQRMMGGALDMDATEVKFLLDETGVPIKVEKKHRIDTNRLIEEFMLLANKRVAEYLSKKTKKGVAIYRVHDKPDPDKMRDLWHYLKTLGYNLPYKKGVIPSVELNALLREISERDIKDAIQTAVVRSMAKAVYTVENIGHYGLGFSFYTHFTSPIRRYPDVMVHRLLFDCLMNKPISHKAFAFYKKMAERSSERERDAQEAEWNSIKYKQVEYMSARIGQKYEGMVSGITQMGLFIRERETLTEGLVRIEKIPGDTYTFNEETLTIEGQKTKKTYRIGDPVNIEVMAANIENRTVDYALLP